MFHEILRLHDSLLYALIHSCKNDKLKKLVRTRVKIEGGGQELTTRMSTHYSLVAIA